MDSRVQIKDTIYISLIVVFIYYFLSTIFISIFSNILKTILLLASTFTSFILYNNYVKPIKPSGNIGYIIKTTIVTFIFYIVGFYIQTLLLFSQYISSVPSFLMQFIVERFLAIVFGYYLVNIILANKTLQMQNDQVYTELSFREKVSFSYLGMRLFAGGFTGWVLGRGVWNIYPRLMLFLGLMTPNVALLYMITNPSLVFQIVWALIGAFYLGYKFLRG
jgi:hypothetical protein